MSRADKWTEFVKCLCAVSVVILWGVFLSFIEMGTPSTNPEFWGNMMIALSIAGIPVLLSGSTLLYLVERKYITKKRRK